MVRVRVRKVANKYTPVLDYKIDEDLNVFKSFGKCIKFSSHWILRSRSDLILCDEIVDQP